MLVAVDRVRLDGRADVGDDLLGQAAVGRGEGLPLALRGVDGLGEGDALDRGCRLVRGQQVGDLGLERDLERILGQRRLVVPVRRRAIIEDGRASERGGARPGDPDGLAGDTVGLGDGQDVRRGEAPGAIDQDAHAEALALSGGDPLDPSGLDRDAFVTPPDDADVRVARAQHRGRIKGAIGEFLHARRSLAEGQCGGRDSQNVVLPETACTVRYRPRPRTTNEATSGR